MSDSSTPGTPPPPGPPPRPGGRTAMTFLLIALGVILIFPGICSLAVIIILAGIDPKSALSDGGLVSLWTVCFVVAVGGVVLIRYAVARNRSPP
jgi:hypothetical protein